MQGRVLTERIGFRADQFKGGFTGLFENRLVFDEIRQHEAGYATLSGAQELARSASRKIMISD